jgi:hypothetical protein
VVEAAVTPHDEHPFFNAKTFLLLVVCGVVLSLAGGVLVADGLKTPTAGDLQRLEFPCPVEVTEDTYHVQGTDVRSYAFTIPGGPKIAFPVKTPGREAVIAALASSAPGTTCVAFVGQSLDLSLYGLSTRDEAGERTVLRFEDAFTANRDVRFPAGLCVAGIALDVLMLVARRRFLAS